MAKTIVFETINPDYKAEHIRVEIRPHNPVTQCLIAHQYEPVMVGFHQPLAEGMSVCKHGDTYNLETGCRLALISALRKVREKAIRRVVWVEYLKLFPVPSRTPTRKAIHKSSAFAEMIIGALSKSIERSMERSVRDSVFHIQS